LFVIGELTVVNVFLTSGESTFGDAMTATLFGPIVYVIALFIFDYFVGATMWAAAGYEVALAIAFLSWIAVFKGSFNTNWVLTFVLALIAILVFAGVSMLFGALIGIFVPMPFFPTA
jgi:ABC-type uncharacterized transport system permease subunit